ncbi:TPA: hypothetical protein ACTUXY_003343 [Legionella pneumophila]
MLKLLTGPVKLPGASLYLPVALSLTRLENQKKCMMALPRAIPDSLSITWPLCIFTAKPMKSLSTPKIELDTLKTILLEDYLTQTNTLGGSSTGPLNDVQKNTNALQ